MDTEKLGLLIDRLSAANEAGKLQWVRGVSSESYQTSFPNSSIVLEDVRLVSLDQFAAQMGEALNPLRKKSRPGIRLRVLDELGQTVAEVSMPELEQRGDGRRASLLKQLYERARYEAGGERVIDELLASLAAESR